MRKTLSNADMLSVCQWFDKCASGMAHHIVLYFSKVKLSNYENVKTESTEAFN